jgi:hypothetical protein
VRSIPSSLPRCAVFYTSTIALLRITAPSYRYKLYATSDFIESLARIKRYVCNLMPFPRCAPYLHTRLMPGAHMK